MAPPVRDALALYAAFWAGLFLLAGAEDKDVGKNDTHHHYNCDTLNPEGWTESRIDWCCLYEHKACRFDCEAALNGWEDSWSLLKKEWCCKNKQVGCSKLGLESTAAPTGLATPAPLTSTVLTTVARTSAPEPTTTVPVTVETTTPVVATVAPTTAESTTSVPVTTTAPAATVAPITVASTTALPLTTAAPAATDESLATTVPAVSAAPGSAVLSESCFEEKIAWDPLDMPGTFPTPVKNAAACQALCANTTGCVHFTFWWIGKSCHLQDAYVVRQTGRLGFVSGPFRCWDDVDQTDYVRKGRLEGLSILESLVSFRSSAMVETIPQYVVEEDEGVVFYMGAHAYVPRLVQANVPWQRPAMPSLKYSTKRDTGSSLKSLGSDTYAPSGIPLKPEDLLAGPKPTQKKDISVGSLGGAGELWKKGSFKGVPSSKEPLKNLVEMLEKK